MCENIWYANKSHWSFYWGFGKKKSIVIVSTTEWKINKCTATMSFHMFYACKKCDVFSGMRVFLHITLVSNSNEIVLSDCSCFESHDYLTMVALILLRDIFMDAMLTHWDRVAYLCVRNLTTIGSYNGLSPGRRYANICTNAWIKLIRLNKLQGNFNRNSYIFF